MSYDPVLKAALKQALDSDPRNGPLWAHYAEMLLSAAEPAGAIDAFRKAIELGAASSLHVRRLVQLLREDGQLAEALIRAEQTLDRVDDPELRIELVRVLLARGQTDEALRQYERALERNPACAQPDLAEQLRMASNEDPGDAEEWEADDDQDSDEDDRSPAKARIGDDKPDIDALANEFFSPDEIISFSDVVGLDDVKQQINLRIIAPFKKQHIFQAFSRKGGGGILLFGPPGCGKTFIARATAGELGARFMSVGIHEMVDKYWGESEKIMHALFEEARRRAPTVIFFDEFDALGSARGRGESQFWKTLVDQLLQEMDGVGSRNENVLIFAATNVPWNVDSAFRRPGRFDRLLFVPPPDLKARREILRRQIEQLPGGNKIAVDALGPLTELFTGADLNSLCERASESALARSLESDQVHPVTTEDFKLAVKTMASSAGEWLSTARNYARYSNENGQYNDLVEYLRKVKKW